MKKIFFLFLILSSPNLKAQCGFRSDYIKWKQDSIKNSKTDTSTKKTCHRDTQTQTTSTKWISPKGKKLTK